MAGMVGECPKCGSIDLEYSESPVLDGDDLYFDIKCNTCGLAAREFHTIEFVGYFDAEGKKFEE